MLSHEEMVGLQSEKHDLIDADGSKTKEQYVLHLIHTVAYVQASHWVEGKKVLDLGCNTGYGTEILSRKASRVVGVDVSEKAIATAKNRYARSGIAFEQIDGTRLPFQDGEFDLIVSFQVIEHIVDCSVYVSELKRVLAPNGIVVFSTPNAVLRLDPGMRPWNEFHIREFEASELASLLKTFFSHVHVRGLFAKDPLYSIEASRVNRAREAARGNESSGGSRFRSLAKKMIPEFLWAKLKGARSFVGGNSEALADTEFMERHGVDDFFHRPDRLEEALDLLAICSDDAEAFQRIQFEKCE